MSELQHERRPSASSEDLSVVADYLATMAAHMARLARNHRFDALGFLFEMAAMEAANVAARQAQPDDDPD